MTDDPLIGRQLANFQIERVIGRGGMAQVYYGHDVKLERPVAIKVIDARYRDDPVYARRFVREAKTVATWRHENIVQVFFADEQDGYYYFAMEYVDGPSLAEILAQGEAKGELLPPTEVLRIGQAIAAALDYAHRKGVIHRDVKPANVMMTSEGRVILTDFGLAMDVQQGSQGEVFGSSHYIAPEQARSSANAVPQSDLYSLAIILFEMLTGVVPFDDPSPTSVALQHVTQPPPAPRKINPNLSTEVEAVLLKALSKSPRDRYQTGKELIQSLAEALQAAPPVGAGRADLSSPAGAPHLEDSLLGRELDEYRLDAVLGKGGMARIYRGLDVRLKRQVAIKVIDTPFRSDSDYIARFEREAQAIAQLEHPNIVRLYRYGEADGVLYMAMQYIEGTTLQVELDAYRQRQTFIPPQEAMRIVRDACLALDYAHGKGVIHRDVKPSNLMLADNGLAVLTDFGLALLTDVGTRGEVLGSLHYISPEQAISSAGAVPQSDLYAVGVILYEMFTGHLPFDAEDPLDIAMMHMSDAPRPPRELRADLSRELEAVILKAMAKDPQDRYPSGATLADALDKALKTWDVEATKPLPPGEPLPSEPISKEERLRPLPPLPAAVASPAPSDAPPVTPPATAPPAGPPARNRRRLLAIAGLVGLVAVTVLALALWQMGVFGDLGWIATPVPTDTIAPASPTAEALTQATSGPTVLLPATDTATPPPTTAPTKTPTVMPTATPTPEWTPPPTASARPTETPTPSPTPSPTPTERPKATPRPTTMPTATPTPLPATLAELQGWILFWSDRDGQDAVYALRPDSGEVIALPGRRLYNEAAGKEIIHPDGLWRLEVRDYEGNADIWRVGQDSDYRLTSNEFDDYDPAWAPNGQQIAFVSGRFGSDDILVITGELQGELRLTYYSGFDKHPSWSPDGSRIVFWSDREGGRKQIWIINLADGSLTNLSNSPYNDWDPVWVK